MGRRQRTGLRQVITPRRSHDPRGGAPACGLNDSYNAIHPSPPILLSVISAPSVVPSRASKPLREASQPLREASKPLREASKPFREASKSFREASKSFREASK